VGYSKEAGSARGQGQTSNAKERQEMKHSVNTVCSCEYCQMIDVMWGDPALNLWESKFVASVARFGWLADYSEKQKACIVRIFRHQKKLYESKKC